jgi:hypothetical protein
MGPGVRPELGEIQRFRTVFSQAFLKDLDSRRVCHSDFQTAQASSASCLFGKV